MMRIFMAPMTSPITRTLQADGATWEALLLELDTKNEQDILDTLVKALPSSFTRSATVRATVPRKTASQILTIAGLSG